MLLFLIGHSLISICKPLSFFHFKVGGTWAHIRKIYRGLHTISNGTLSGFYIKWFYTLLFYDFTYLFYVVCIMAEVDKWHYNLRSGTDIV